MRNVQPCGEHLLVAGKHQSCRAIRYSFGNRLLQRMAQRGVECVDGRAGEAEFDDAAVVAKSFDGHGEVIRKAAGIIGA